MKCPNGHTLCLKCKSKVHVCPICRHELGNIRCLALEKIAESLELPCRYQFFGCQDIFTYHSRLRHEQNCRFRPYNCPYAGSECTVTGDIQSLVAHLKDDHKVDMHDGCTFNHRYVKSNPQDVENATWMLTVSSLSLSSIPFFLSLERPEDGKLTRSALHNLMVPYTNCLLFFASFRHDRTA